MKCQLTPHPLPRRNNTYLLTLQVNCDKEETQRRRDHSWIFCLFARKRGKSVDQSKNAIYKRAISKQKQKIALRQGWKWTFKQTTFENRKFNPHSSYISFCDGSGRKTDGCFFVLFFFFVLTDVSHSLPYEPAWHCQKRRHRWIPLR